MKEFKFDIEGLRARYSGGVNSLTLPRLSGRQMDIFYSILAFTHKQNLENKGKTMGRLGEFFDPKKRTITMTLPQFLRLIGADNWGQSLTHKMLEIEKFVDTILDYKMKYYDKDTKELIGFVAYEEFRWNMVEQTITITFQKTFWDIAVRNGLGFSDYEIAELHTLYGEYAKRLYVNLKQWRGTGEWLIKYDDFKTYMQVPDNYKSGNIDQKVIQQAIKELTRQRTLFDQERTPFINLKYEKLTRAKKPNNKGMKPYWIKFTFKKEDDTPSLIIANLRGKIWIEPQKTLEKGEIGDKPIVYQIDNLIFRDNRLIVYAWELDSPNTQIKIKELHWQEERTLKEFAKYVEKHSHSIEPKFKKITAQDKINPSGLLGIMPSKPMEKIKKFTETMMAKCY